MGLSLEIREGGVDGMLDNIQDPTTVGRLETVLQ